jgi:hypothetical protein
MTIADKVDRFYAELGLSVGCFGGGEPIYSCEPGTHPAQHSKFFAREAARETSLPAWLQNIAEKEFSCTCETIYGFEKFVRAAITDLTARGEHHDAQNLRDRLEGFWDTELREAIEEVCRDDSEALEVVLRRFTKWRETGKRKSGRTLGHFVNQIDDVLLVSVAREAQRRRGDFDYPFSALEMLERRESNNELGSAESEADTPF